MKKLLRITNVIGAVAIVWALVGCETTSTSNSAAIKTSQKETLLTQAGFRAKDVTTPKQKQRVEQLPVGVVSAVKYQGKLYYVYPTTKKDQILVGKQPQFDSYKKMLAAQRAKTQPKQSTAPAQQTNATRQAEIQQEAQQDAYSPAVTEETAGPRRIQVQVFDGFDNMWEGD
jgi:hypothetical protein